MHPERLSDLRKGLSDLKVGALLSLLTYVILLVALLSSLSLLPMFTLMLGQLELTSLISVMPLLSIVLLAVLAALVTSLAAFYKFFRATGHLKRFDAPKLGIGRIGVLLGIVGAVVILLGSISLMSLTMTSASLNAPLESLEYLSPYGLYAFTGVLVVGAIVIVIGEILFSVMVMRLGEVEGLDSGFRTAGILYLAGILIAFIPLVSLLALVLEIVALILIYRCSESSLRFLASVPRP
ncbi:MAG: DUF973 family protein [Candidatus Korarchaeum sp.]